MSFLGFLALMCLRFRVQTVKHEDHETHDRDVPELLLESSALFISCLLRSSREANKEWGVWLISYPRDIHLLKDSYRCIVNKYRCGEVKA